MPERNRPPEIQRARMNHHGRVSFAETPGPARVPIYDLVDRLELDEMIAAPDRADKRITCRSGSSAGSDPLKETFAGLCTLDSAAAMHSPSRLGDAVRTESRQQARD